MFKWLRALSCPPTRYAVMLENLKRIPGSPDDLVTVEQMRSIGMTDADIRECLRDLMIEK